MEAPPSPTDRLCISSRTDRLVIEPRGLLDAGVVRAVAAVLSAEDGHRPIEIDLSRLEGHTGGAAASLARLVGGDRAVAYRARSEAGQQALLAIARGQVLE